MDGHDKRSSGRSTVAILGAGKLGTALLDSLSSLAWLDVVQVAARDPRSEGLPAARRLGCRVTIGSVEAVTSIDEIQVVFDATTAREHRRHRNLLRAAGKLVVDLTGGADDPYVVPWVNPELAEGAPVVGLVSSCAQATVPIVAAISSCVPVQYAEAMTTLSAHAVGAGSRASIDELTWRSGRALNLVGGARRAKAMVQLTSAPLPMSSIVRCQIDADTTELSARTNGISDAIRDMVGRMRRTLPGYGLQGQPTVSDGVVFVHLQVFGGSNQLPDHCGNLELLACGAAMAARSQLAVGAASATLPDRLRGSGAR